MMDKDAVILLAQSIKGLFTENKDYLILDMSTEQYNNFFAECSKIIAESRVKRSTDELLLEKIHSQMYKTMNDREGEKPLP